MTRGIAIYRYAQAKARAAKLRRQITQMRREIDTLLALKIRPADNVPMLITEVARIAKKYQTPLI